MVLPLVLTLLVLNDQIDECATAMPTRVPPSILRLNAKISAPKPCISLVSSFCSSSTYCRISLTSESGSSLCDMCSSLKLNGRLNHIPTLCSGNLVNTLWQRQLPLLIGCLNKTSTDRFAAIASPDAQLVCRTIPRECISPPAPELPKLFSFILT